jgi:hypothetical protein
VIVVFEESILTDSNALADWKIEAREHAIANATSIIKAGFSMVPLNIRMVEEINYSPKRTSCSAKRTLIIC